MNAEFGSRRRAQSAPSESSPKESMLSKAKAQYIEFRPVDSNYPTTERGCG